jgi:hypothetical protein
MGGEGVEMLTLMWELTCAAGEFSSLGGLGFELLRGTQAVRPTR